ncbi:MAG: hypothetical protein V3V33_13385 [Candidatus Lokiarchaeia archaeon]
MRYYWLTNSIDTKIIGRYDQSESAYNASQLYDIGENGGILKDFIVPEPFVHSKANLTSYLSCVPISNIKFLILKKELIEFLKDFKIDSFQTWNMKVHYKDRIIKDYSLFHLYQSSQGKYVDYKNSEFYVGNIKDHKWVGETINVSDYKFFLSTIEILRNQKLILKGRKLVFNFSEATEDLIRITDTPPIVGSKGYYISERLKSAIEENGYTGMAFKEIDNRKRIEVIY